MTRFNNATAFESDTLCVRYFQKQDTVYLSKCFRQVHLRTRPRKSCIWAFQCASNRLGTDFWLFSHQTLIDSISTQYQTLQFCLLFCEFLQHWTYLNSVLMLHAENDNPVSVSTCGNFLFNASVSNGDVTRFAITCMLSLA